MSGLDKMLAEWPTASETDLERDERAQRAIEAIQSASTGKDADLDAILSPPLPARESEGKLTAAQPGRASITGVENKMSKDRAKDRTSFQELAKLAGTPPPAPVASATPPPAAVVRGEESSSDDSGVVDLKAVAALDPGAEQRAQSTPLAAQGLFDEDAPPASAAQTAPPASVQAVAQSAPPPAAVSAPPPVASVPPPSASAAPSVAPAAAVTPKKEEKKKGGGMILLFGGLLAAGAIAAGAFFVIKSGALGGGQSASVATTKPVETTAPQAKSTATAAATVAAVDTSQQGVGLDSLPTNNGGSTDPLRTMPKINAVGNGSKPAGSVADTTPAPSASAIDPKLVANNIPNSTGGGGGDLTEAMRAAAGGGTVTTGGSDTPGGPQFAPGTVPQKPSQGQVQGAINAVLPEARKCMAEGDPLSRATIVFQSDGTVKSVSVTGFAAGKSNEACVKTALSKAKISPFVEATYSFPVNVRPM